MKTLQLKDLKPRTSGDTLFKRLIEGSETCSSCHLLFSGPEEKESIRNTGVCLSDDHVEGEKYD